MTGEIDIDVIRESYDCKKYPNFYMYLYVCCEVEMAKGFEQINIMQNGERIMQYGYAHAMRQMPEPKRISR